MAVALPRRLFLSRAALGGAALAVSPRFVGAALPERAPSRSATPSPDALLRLGSNENPWGPSERARAALRDAAALANRYVDPRALEEAYAASHGLAPENVLAGPGSQSLLCLAGLAFGGPGTEIVGADPTYAALLAYAEAVGTTVVRVPLTGGDAHDLPAMAAAITARTKLVYVCNPNNPTGTIVSGASLRSFLDALPKGAVAFVDEAYRDYATSPPFSSVVDLVREGRDVVVAHTFSKIHGLAGARVGTLVARPDIVARLRKLQMGTGVTALSRLGVAAALASLGDREFLETCRKRNAEGRDAAARALASRGFTVPPSEANFVWFRPRFAPEALGKELEGRGVRIVARAGTPGCRLTIGTPDEMRRFFATFDESLGALRASA